MRFRGRADAVIELGISEVDRFLDMLKDLEKNSWKPDTEVINAFNTILEKYNSEDSPIFFIEAEVPIAVNEVIFTPVIDEIKLEDVKDD